MRVALMKWTGPETIPRALEALDAWEGFRFRMKVLVKPNAVLAVTVCWENAPSRKTKR